MSDIANNAVRQMAGREQTLEAERAVNAKLAGDTDGVQTNEASLLSLMTLKEFYKNDPAQVDIIDKCARNESLYVMEALRALYGQEEREAGKQAQAELRDMFGRSFEGNLKLASLIKEQADRKRREELVASSVSKINAGGRKGAFA